MIRRFVAVGCLFAAAVLFDPGPQGDASAAKSIDETPGRMTWGVGDHYKLPTDPDGWSIVEPGKKTTKRLPRGAAD